MSGHATCISKEYTSPKAPIAKGMFFPSMETPCRSPRLAAKRKTTAQHDDGSQAVCTSEASPSLIHTPTREALKKLIQQREGTTSLLDDCEAFLRAYSKTLEASDITTDESNNLRRYLVVTRKLKVYDEVVGPHDALWLLVREDGKYRCLLYEKTLEKSTVQPPITSSSIPILDKFGDVQWTICPGVKAYSSFKASIGYDIKRAASVNWPPDTA